MLLSDALIITATKYSLLTNALWEFVLISAFGKLKCVNMMVWISCYIHFHRHTSRIGTSCTVLSYDYLIASKVFNGNLDWRIGEEHNFNENQHASKRFWSNGQFYPIIGVESRFWLDISRNAETHLTLESSQSRSRTHVVSVMIQYKRVRSLYLIVGETGNSFSHGWIMTNCFWPVVSSRGGFNPIID